MLSPQYSTEPPLAALLPGAIAIVALWGATAAFLWWASRRWLSSPSSILRVLACSFVAGLCSLMAWTSMDRGAWSVAVGLAAWVSAALATYPERPLRATAVGVAGYAVLALTWRIIHAPLHLPL